MKSPVGALVGTIVNKAPVAYASRHLSLPFLSRNDAEAQMRALGGVGTLFAIVERTTEAVSKARWRLYRKSATGDDADREEVTSHLALKIWNKPNDFYTQAEFVQSFAQHLDLTGEAWWIIARNSRARSIPLELWIARPDRMYPVPSATDFLTGYIYFGPEGEQVPLRLDEVIQLRKPHPLDPYRGMGAVQTILADLDSSKYSAEWNRNFFINSAQPGGIIEVDKRLSDDEFEEMTERWQEQHRGVANAHRVAVIEQGKWITNNYTMRDMQFVELRDASRAVILEAFGFPKHMLGISEDVNRANADAAEVMFARWIVKPRLDRIKGALNNDFLPLFGTTAKGLEFDYDDPVPADEEIASKKLTAQANAAKALKDAGWHEDDVLSAVGLPEMRYITAPTPVAVPPRPAVEAPAARLGIDIRHHTPEPGPAMVAASPSVSLYDLARTRRAIPPVRNEDNPADEVDLGPVQRSHEAALGDLAADWQRIQAGQISDLAGQVQRVVDGGNLADLPGMTVPTGDAQRALAEAMTALAGDAAVQAAAEAAAQNVTIEPVPPPGGDMSAVAAVVVGLLAAGLVASAAGEALRVAAPGSDGAQVAAQVRTHLEGLSDAATRDRLGGALHKAQHAGRMSTFGAVPTDGGGPVPAYYGSEVLDSATCRYCREVDGRFLGLDLSQAAAEYPTGGYIRCEGRERCRGHVVIVWRPGADKSQWVEKEPL